MSSSIKDQPVRDQFFDRCNQTVEQLSGVASRLAALEKDTSALADRVTQPNTVQDNMGTLCSVSNVTFIAIDSLHTIANAIGGYYAVKHSGKSYNGLEIWNAACNKVLGTITSLGYGYLIIRHCAFTNNESSEK